jgi:hypothetical protein
LISASAVDPNTQLEAGARVIGTDRQPITLTGSWDHLIPTAVRF